MTPASQNDGQVLARNRKARHNYHVEDKLEAGIALVGTEVKSIRDSQFSMDEAFAQFEGRELYLMQMHVQPYTHGNRFNHDPVRPRKLLMHRSELTRLSVQLTSKGLTLIPLKIYLKRGKIKVQLGVCKGKDNVDKRHDLKTREADRETRRAISDARKR